ncbi:hypothetical protein ACQP1U_12965 [Actinomycetota bacterium]
MQTWDEILHAIQQSLAGRSTTARAALQACWDHTGEQDAAQRCVIAHYLADQQEALDDEIAWDETALSAFPGIADGDLAAIGVPSSAAFEPSLRLNLGDGYRRAGRLEEARAQLELAQASAHLLPTEGYGAMIRGGIQKLSDRLSGPSR